MGLETIANNPSKSKLASLMAELFHQGIFKRNSANSGIPGTLYLIALRGGFRSRLGLAEHASGNLLQSSDKFVVPQTEKREFQTPLLAGPARP